jgi:hypothetical protein
MQSVFILRSHKSTKSSHSLTKNCTKIRSESKEKTQNFKGRFFWIFQVLYSTLLHLSPLRVQCERGCWFESRFVATLALAVRSSNHSARSQPLTDGILPNMDDTQSLSFGLWHWPWKILVTYKNHKNTKRVIDHLLKCTINFHVVFAWEIS